MIWLVLAIVCSSLIALIWKLADTIRCDRITLLRWNYLVAFCLSGASVIETYSRQPLSFQLPLVLRLSFLAIPVGFLFFLSFELYATSIEKNGAILSAGIAKMGVFLPITLSFLLWHQPLSGKTFIGIGLGILFLVGYAFYISLQERTRSASVMLLVWLCITQGLAEFSNKVFQANFAIEWRGIFLALVFLSAFISSFLLRRSSSKAFFTLVHWRLGTILGLVNFGSSYYLIKAFSTLYAPVAFLGFSLGTMMLVSVVSVLWFHEVFNREKQIILAFSAIIVILLYS